MLFVEVNIQEADALGVNLSSFGDTLTAEEAAELMAPGQSEAMELGIVNLDL
jgi:hypothetical protein